MIEEESKESLDDAEPMRGRIFWSHLTRGQKALAVIVVIVFLYVFYVTLDANKYRATVLVVEGEGRVGVNPTTEVLDFGDLSPGSSAVRRVNVANDTPIPFYVFAMRFGEVSDLMKLDRNFFVLPARRAERIEFTVYMPASAPMGQRLNGRVYLFKIPGPFRSS